MDPSTQTDIRNKEVAITGRMASMSREEAAQAIREAGGACVESPTERTDLLVVGADGPPLGRDGRVTNSLRRAEELLAAGVGIEILEEEEFISRLGTSGPREELRRLYTSAQLARILDVPVVRIRGWVRAGLIEPAKVVRRLCYFDFRQVSGARRIEQLTRSGVTPARIAKSLARLGSWYTSTMPSLAQLEILEGGGPILVRLEDGRLAEPGGQLHLDFREGSGIDGSEEDREPVLSLRPREHSPQDWFNIGIAAEEAGNHESAVEAYQKALSLGDPVPEVCFNLGNTFYAMSRNVEAAACFIQATELEPDYVEAWNNLGNALAEIGRHEQAIPAYQRALSIEPKYADAHYNLGETLAMIDDLSGAERHWLAYLEQDPQQPLGDPGAGAAVGIVVGTAPTTCSPVAPRSPASDPRRPSGRRGTCRRVPRSEGAPSGS